MRANFSEYTIPSNSEFEHLWASGYIVLDANALLDLFRLSKDARNEFLSVLHDKRGSLWVPHQVGREFHQNYYRVLNDMEREPGRVLDAIQEQREICRGNS